MKLAVFLSVTILSLLISTNEAVCANQLMFRHYKVEDGLSSNTIQCIAQDSKGFIWIGTSDGLNRFDSFNFKVYRHIIGDSTSLGNNSIQALYEDENLIWIGTDTGVFTYDQNTEKFKPFSMNFDGTSNFEAPTYSITSDKKGNIWIATIGQGLFRFDKNDGRLYQYKNNQHDRKSISSDYITKLLVDSEGKLWIATTMEGLNVYDPLEDNFIRFSPGSNEGELNEPSAFELFEDSFGNIWIGGWSKGLIRYDKEKQQFSNYLNASSNGIIRHIHSIDEYSPGQLMVSSDDGLTFFSTVSGSYNTITYNPFDSRGLNDNFVYPVFKDKEGGVWLGTYFGGINYLATNYYFFNLYTYSSGKNSLSGRVVSKFCGGNDGYVWIGTDDGGLNRFKLEDKSFERIYLDDKNEIPQNIHALWMDGDYLWIGTFMRGLYKLNIKNGTIKNYTKGNSIRSLNDYSVYSAYKDNSGNLWIGTQLGINLYNYDTDDFSRVQEIGWGSDVVDITQDNSGFVWFASQRKGIYRYNLRTKEFSNYLNNKPTGEYFLPDNRINCLCVDNNNQLWVGTASAGLCQYDKNSNSFIRAEADEYIFDSAIYAIIPDYNDLWITTNKGLIRFNTNTKKVHIYNAFDGLQSNQFNQNSGIKIFTGEIFIGGVNGFNTFNPASIKENPYIPPVVYTNFQVFNKNVAIGKHSILKKSIENSNKIILNSKQSIFSIEFIALSYCAPLKNQYVYKLEGFDKEWVDLRGHDHKVTYTNLSPGNYTFRVKASNNDGVWNNEGNYIQIIISPPWWKSQMMYIIYILFVFGLITFTFIFLLNRRKKVYDKNMKELEAKKELELLDSKLHFFTHIAHEIRTPVSLISAPLEKVLNSVLNLPDSVKEDLNIAQKNSNRLLYLVNELLDFRKTEQSLDQLNFSLIDIKSLIKQTVDRFQPLAHQKGIRLIDSNIESVLGYSDQEALTKILSNLLTNALKYTKDEIYISLETISYNRFKIIVKDNGIGIDDAEKDKIFSLFYQGDTQYEGMMKGFGIGLSLVDMLVKKLNGTISLESKKGEFSKFILEFPLGDVSRNSQDISLNFNQGNFEYFHANQDEGIITNPLKIKEMKRGNLLIVEDNDELSKFLESNFNRDFNTFLAENGVKALQILCNYQIELVISDVMMPEMDGIEMSRIIKNDVRFSHIPIVLLTARTDTQTKIEGLEGGADVYIEKPFSIQFLIAQVNSLITNRENLREIFSNTPFAPLSSVTKTKTDEDLLKRINKVIEMNISNTDFSVDDIASYLNMSRSVLYVKIKAIFGLTPNDFIRLVRLRKAAEYLSKGEYRVSEVCYLTGFNSPSYFSKCFQKQFGVLPKDFVK